MQEEVERWQSLQADKEALETEWREQQAMMQEQHERVIQELTEKYEAELEEERMNIEKLEQEKEEMEREFQEIQRQVRRWRRGGEERERRGRGRGAPETRSLVMTAHGTRATARSESSEADGST